MSQYLYSVPGGKTYVDANGRSNIRLNPYSADIEAQYINNYHVQNEMLQKLKEFQSGNDSKVSNLKIQIYNLNYYNYIVLWIYLGLSLIFIIFCFFGNKMSNLSFLLKVLLSALLVLFPFFITTIEQGLLKIISFVWNLVNGSAYISPSY